MNDNYFKIPNGWHLVTLEKISKFITKGATPTTYGFNWSDEASGIPFLRSECVTSNGFNYKGLTYIPLEAHNVMERSKIVPGDILITITGNIGRIAMLPDNIPEANINQHISRISIRDEYYSKYVFQALHLEFYSRYYERILTGQAYPQISLKQVRETPILLPPYEEQKLIATILFNFDRKIELIKNKISETKNLKTGVAQHLFSKGVGIQGTDGNWQPHNKFSENGYPLTWKLTKIGNISKVTSGGTPSRQVASYWLNGAIPWVTTSEVNFNKISTTEQKITALALKNSAAKIFPRGTVLMAMYGQGQTRGRVAILDIEAATNQACAAIICNSELNSKFCYHYLSSQYEKIRCVGNEGSQKNLNGQIIKNLLIPCPPLDEQKELVSILDTLDKTIELLKKQKSETQLLKKGLMQKLLTGEWRVPLDYDEEEAA